MVHVSDQFTDARPFWPGLDNPSFRCLVLKIVDWDRLGSEFAISDLTTFEPGEASSLHRHPSSEEITFIVRGRGEVVIADGDPALPPSTASCSFPAVRPTHTSTPAGSRCGRSSSTRHTVTPRPSTTCLSPNPQR